MIRTSAITMPSMVNLGLCTPLAEAKKFYRFFVSIKKLTREFSNWIYERRCCCPLNQPIYFDADEFDR